MENKILTFVMGDFNATAEKNEKWNFSHDLKLIVDATDMQELVEKKDCLPTFISSRGSSRIDRIYLNRKSRLKNVNIETTTYTESDHRAIQVEFEIDNQSVTPRPNRKSPYWKLNTAILDEDDYKENIKFVINQEKKQLDKNTNIQNWWSKVKIKCKEISIEYCKERNRQRKTTEKFKEKLLKEIAKKIEEGEVERNKQYLQIKRKFYLPTEDPMEGIGIRGRLQCPIQNETIGASHLLNEKKEQR